MLRDMHGESEKGEAEKKKRYYYYKGKERKAKEVKKWSPQETLEYPFYH